MKKVFLGGRDSVRFEYHTEGEMCRSREMWRTFPVNDNLRRTLRNPLL